MFSDFPDGHQLSSNVSFTWAQVSAHTQLLDRPSHWCRRWLHMFDLQSSIGAVSGMAKKQQTREKRAKKWENKKLHTCDDRRRREEIRESRWKLMECVITRLLVLSFNCYQHPMSSQMLDVVPVRISDSNRSGEPRWTWRKKCNSCNSNGTNHDSLWLLINHFNFFCAPCVCEIQRVSLSPAPWLCLTADWENIV